MDFIIYSVALLYLINAIYYFIGILRLKRACSSPGNQTSEKHFVSVIVPARNEEENLPQNIKAISEQKYPTDLWELIIVDDGSTDKTRLIAEQFSAENEHISVIANSLNKGHGHKKNAVQMGVELAKGEIIVTTDADCVMSQYWLESLVREFDNYTGMVIGLPVYRFKNNLLESYQALDYASLSIIAASLVKNKTPIMCSAANMAYRKKTFDDVDGYSAVDHFVSGDDDLLMQKIVKDGRWKINSTINPASFTYTKPVDSWKKMLNQRSRWGSKGAFYPLKWVRLYLSLIFLIQLTFALGWLFADLESMLNIWAIKFLVDVVMTFFIINVLANFRLLLGFPLVYLTQPFLIVTAAVKGFFGMFSWK